MNRGAVDAKVVEKRGREVEKKKVVASGSGSESKQVIFSSVRLGDTAWALCSSGLTKFYIDRSFRVSLNRLTVKGEAHDQPLTWEVNSGNKAVARLKIDVASGKLWERTSVKVESGSIHRLSVKTYQLYNPATDGWCGFEAIGRLATSYSERLEKVSKTELVKTGLTILYEKVQAVKRLISHQQAKLGQLVNDRWRLYQTPSVTNGNQLFAMVDRREVLQQSSWLSAYQAMLVGRGVFVLNTVANHTTQVTQVSRWISIRQGEFTPDQFLLLVHNHWFALTDKALLYAPLLKSDLPLQEEKKVQQPLDRPPRVEKPLQSVQTGAGPLLKTEKRILAQQGLFKVIQNPMKVKPGIQQQLLYPVVTYNKVTGALSLRKKQQLVLEEHKAYPKWMLTLAQGLYKLVLKRKVNCIIVQGQIQFQQVILMVLNLILPHLAPDVFYVTENEEIRRLYQAGAIVTVTRQLHYVQKFSILQSLPAVHRSFVLSTQEQASGPNFFYFRFYLSGSVNNNVAWQLILTGGRTRALSQFFGSKNHSRVILYQAKTAVLTLEEGVMRAGGQKVVVFRLTDVFGDIMIQGDDGVNRQFQGSGVRAVVGLLSEESLQVHIQGQSASVDQAGFLAYSIPVAVIEDLMAQLPSQVSWRSLRQSSNTAAFNKVVKAMRSAGVPTFRGTYATHFHALCSYQQYYLRNIEGSPYEHKPYHPDFLHKVVGCLGSDRVTLVMSSLFIARAMINCFTQQVKRVGWMMSLRASPSVGTVVKIGARGLIWPAIVFILQAALKYSKGQAGSVRFKDRKVSMIRRLVSMIYGRFSLERFMAPHGGMQPPFVSNDVKFSQPLVGLRATSLGHDVPLPTFNNNVLAHDVQHVVCQQQPVTLHHFGANIQGFVETIKLVTHHNCPQNRASALYNRQFATKLRPYKPMVENFSTFFKTKVLSQLKVEVSQVPSYEEYLLKVEPSKRALYQRARFASQCKSLGNDFTLIVKQGEMSYEAHKDVDGVGKAGCRAIMNPSMRMKGFPCYHNTVLIQVMKQNIDWFVHGLNTQQLCEKIDSHILQAGFQKGVLVTASSDLSRFDAHQHACLRKAVDETVIRWWAAHGPPHQMFGTVDELVQALVVTDATIHVQGLKHEASKVLRCQGTVFSGHPTATTLFNTIRVISYMLYVVQLCGWAVSLRVSRDAPYLLYVAGDDICMIFRNIKYAQEFAKMFPLVISSSKDRVHGLGQCAKKFSLHPNGYLDFLSKHGFMDPSGKYQMIRTLPKFLFGGQVSLNFDKFSRAYGVQKAERWFRYIIGFDLLQWGRNVPIAEKKARILMSLGQKAPAKIYTKISDTSHFDCVAKIGPESRSSILAMWEYFYGVTQSEVVEFQDAMTHNLLWRGSLVDRLAEPSTPSTDQKTRLCQRWLASPILDFVGYPKIQDHFPPQSSEKYKYVHIEDYDPQYEHAYTTDPSILLRGPLSVSSIPLCPKYKEQALRLENMQSNRPRSQNIFPLKNELVSNSAKLQQEREGEGNAKTWFQYSRGQRLQLASKLQLPKKFSQLCKFEPRIAPPKGGGRPKARLVSKTVSQKLVSRRRRRKAKVVRGVKEVEEQEKQGPNLGVPSLPVDKLAQKSYLKASGYAATQMRGGKKVQRLFGGQALNDGVLEYVQQVLNPIASTTLVRAPSLFPVPTSITKCIDVVRVRPLQANGLAVKICSTGAFYADLTDQSIRFMSVYNSGFTASNWGTPTVLNINTPGSPFLNHKALLSNADTMRVVGMEIQATILTQVNQINGYSYTSFAITDEQNVGGAFDISSQSELLTFNFLARRSGLDMQTGPSRAVWFPSDPACYNFTGPLTDGGPVPIDARFNYAGGQLYFMYAGHTTAQIEFRICTIYEWIAKPAILSLMPTQVSKLKESSKSSIGSMISRSLEWGFGQLMNESSPIHKLAKAVPYVGSMVQLMSMKKKPS